MARSEVPTNGWSRRRFLRTLGLAGAAVAAGPALAACGDGDGEPGAQATGAGDGGLSGEPVRIGGMWLLSGPLSLYGEFAQEGAQLAVDELNANGGILGRPVEMLFEHEGSADDVVQVARRLALEENVDFLMGIDSSGTAQALVPGIPDLGKLLMITHAATPAVNGELCNRFVFRCSVNVPQNAYAAAAIAAEQYPDFTTWMGVGPDYAFGHETWDFFSRNLQERQPDVELMTAVFPPFPSEDFSSHINQVLDAAPDGLFVSLWGSDLVNFIRQAKDFGLFDTVTPHFQLGAAMEVLNSLKAEMPTGFWAGTRYWYQSPDTDVNRTFVEEFRSQYDHPPSYNAQNAYTGIQFLAAAAEEAGTTEADGVISALEGMELEVPQGPTLIRAEDHQAIVDVPWGKLTETPDEEFPILDPVQITPGEEATRSVADTGCQMA